jgi:hypothetical protein
MERRASSPGVLFAGVLAESLGRNFLSVTRAGILSS